MYSVTGRSTSRKSSSVRSRIFTALAIVGLMLGAASLVVLALLWLYVLKV